MYRETLLDAENKGVPRLTAVKIHVCTYYLHVCCVLGIATRPFTLKRGFGLQSCPVLYEYRDEDARSAAWLSLRRYQLARRCTTGNLHPSSAVSFPVPAYGFHSDCLVCMQYLACRDSVVLKSADLIAC